MFFIGIYTRSKEFKLIKSKLLELINSNEVNIIRIDKRSIENIKNVKFHTIIISKPLDLQGKEMQNLERMIKNSKYLILNSDISINLKMDKGENLNIVTYGLNQKATVTMSSVTEENILISLQRKMKNIYGETLEVKETNINSVKYYNFTIENILMIYTILMIYNKEKS